MIDGPYGCPPNPRKYSTVVMFASGGGVVPWISMLRDFVKSSKFSNHVTSIGDFFCNDSSTQRPIDIELKDPNGPPFKVYFNWVIRDENEIECFRDTFEEIKMKDTEHRIEIRIWITKANSIENTPDFFGNDLQIITGSRPNIDALFSKLKSNHEDIDGRILCLTCGNVDMMATVGKCCTKYSNWKMVFDFHEETFLF